MSDENLNDFDPTRPPLVGAYERMKRLRAATSLTPDERDWIHRWAFHVILTEEQSQREAAHPGCSARRVVQERCARAMRGES